MSIVSNKNALSPLVKLGIVVSVIFTVPVIASEHESACLTHIQDKIAWNYDGTTRWDPENIKMLCKGTTNPEQPGECFHSAMTGHVKWGISDQWEWKNAVSLCSGTNNSEKRIACFKGRIKAGEQWNEAIFQCQSHEKSDNKVPM